MKKLLSLVFACGIVIAGHAQVPSADTVIVQLAKSSKLTFTMEDKSDLEILEHYDFEAKFIDVKLISTVLIEHKDAHVI